MTISNSQEDLLARAQTGDKSAFDALASAAMGQLRGIVQRMIGHPEDTEDILQDAMLKAWQAIGDFRSESSFSTWLTAIGTRLAIDHLRKQKRWRTEAQIAYANLCAQSEDYGMEVMTEVSAPEFSYEVREHISYCFTCVGRSLPPEEQAALVLRDVAGMSAREAAGVLGITDSVLRHRLSAARNAMESKYDGLCALVSKTGICHQCTGLQMAAPEARKGGPFPDISDLASRFAVVRAHDPASGTMKNFHDLFWRRTKEIEEAGLGSTEPESDCGTET